MDKRFSWEFAEVDKLPALEEGCGECECTGRVIDIAARTAGECPACKGTGYVPTKDGQAMLKFLAAYGGAIIRRYCECSQGRPS